ncbi:MAG: hypothetical protein ACK46G_12435 [Flavobacteriales bacterium]|jgi:hypothetical protein
MRPFSLLLSALSVVALTCISCGDQAPKAPSGPPVVLTGELIVTTSNVALLDCERRSYSLSGALRDSVMYRFSGTAGLPEGQRPWITVQASDSSFSAGTVMDVQKRGPCLVDLPGTYAMEATKDGELAAKINLDVSGIFSFAVAPGDGSRTDVSGQWVREEKAVLLRGPDSKFLLRIVHPDALVLEDTVPFGQVLRMTRR